MNNASINHVIVEKGSEQVRKRYTLISGVLLIGLFLSVVFLTFAQRGAAYLEVSGEAVICGTKFHDLNGNGVWDPDEPGLPEWEIHLSDPTGVATTTFTNDDGSYCFEGLPDGVYLLEEVLMPGWIQTFPPGGGHEVEIVDGQSVDGVNFGNWSVTSGVHGMKWFDMNGDGIKDPDEPGIPDWSIQIVGDSGLVMTTTTDDEGNYWFMDLMTGTYTVTEIMQPGWTQTYPPTEIWIFSYEPTQPIERLDFGNFSQEVGAIHGSKFHDLNANGIWDANEPGLEGWTIILHGNGLVWETTTDANGEYWFMDLPPGDYVISELLQDGWVQTYPDSEVHTVNLPPGEDIFGIDFGNWQPEQGAIHGMKFHDLNGDGVKDTNEPGLPGWTIVLYHEGEIWETTTDANGEYWFMGLLPGTYTVAEIINQGHGQGGDLELTKTKGLTETYWTQTYPMSGTHTIDLGEGEEVFDVDFGNWQEGKDDFCMIPWDNHFLNEDSLVTGVYIFNASTTPEKGYTVQLIGPTTFTVLTPLPVSLNPYEYGAVEVEVDYPGIFTGPSQYAIFHAIVTNLETNTSFTCSAALWSYSPEWWTSPNVNSGLGGGIPADFTQAVSFTVQHNNPMDMVPLSFGGGGYNAEYKIHAMSRGLTETVVSLNGQPPGTVISGQLSVAFGEAVDVGVEIMFMEQDLMAPTDIVFELDVNGDGLPDMVTSYLAIAEPYSSLLPVMADND